MNVAVRPVDPAREHPASPARCLVYVDGRFSPPESAVISVFDHGLLYGDGVYEGIRASGGRVVQLGEHVDRLFRSARSLRLTIPLAREEVAELVLETLRRNHLADAYVRLVVTRGAGDLGPDPSSCPRPSIIVIAEPLPPVRGDELREGVQARIVATRRTSVDGASHEIKSLSYLDSILARMEARSAGADEAIMLDSRGFVAESPICNVFLVAGRHLLTPSVASGILHGITRGLVIRVAPRLDLQVREGDITPYQLRHADEVFLTGTHAGIVPVLTVDGQPTGTGEPGPFTRALGREYAALTRDSRFSVSTTPVAGDS